jgi:integrase
MAREAKLDAKGLLSQGVDPSEKRKAYKRAAAAARTFGQVADEWFATKREPEAKSEATLKRNRWLSRELKSEIGQRPIGEIEPPELLRALKKVQAREHYETASRMRTLASQVLRFGIANGYCQRDMAADLKDALTSPKGKPRLGLVDTAAVGKLCRWRDLDDSGYQNEDAARPSGAAVAAGAGSFDCRQSHQRKSAIRLHHV